MRVLSVVSALALCFAACTNDFGSFSFGREDGSVTDAGGVSPEGGAGGAAGEDDAGADASASPGDASVDSGGMDSGGERDAAPEEDAAEEPGPDAAMDSAQPGDAASVETDAEVDSGQQDSGFSVAVCRDALEPLVPDGRNMCAGCGCWGCGLEVVACLQSGDAAEDALCSDVLQCALQNSCQVWDCYCSSPGCGGGPNGDGPCVAEMNDAADGRKSQVMSIWQSDDDSEPLVRALEAISCLVGRHADSPGGASSGMCEAECL
jgi:hypothetical protein